MKHVSPALLEELEFMQWLKVECGYLGPRPLSGRRYAAILPLFYTHAIVVGQVGNRFGTDDRWCYGSCAEAKAALDAWDGTGEPAGWHRHPGTGRRRLHGDAAAEHVAP